jgi:hypothetical protein
VEFTIDPASDNNKAVIIKNSQLEFVSGVNEAVKEFNKMIKNSEVPEK